MIGTALKKWPHRCTFQPTTSNPRRTIRHEEEGEEGEEEGEEEEDGEEEEEDGEAVAEVVEEVEEEEEEEDAASPVVTARVGVDRRRHPQGVVGVLTGRVRVKEVEPRPTQRRVRRAGCA